MNSLATLPPILLVIFGGGLGAGGRYLVGQWVAAHFGTGLPFGTWLVNILGGLAMGLLVGWLGRLGQMAEPMRLLLGVGVLGGFTTFSAFSLEVANMLIRDELVLAAAYAISSMAGSLLALFAGLMIIRTIGAA